MKLCTLILDHLRHTCGYPKAYFHLMHHIALCLWKRIWISQNNEFISEVYEENNTHLSASQHHGLDLQES